MAKDKVDVDAGVLRIEWAREHMPVLAKLVKSAGRVKPLRGVSVAMALHLEAKTAVLVLALREAGAQVRVAGCNPLSTDDTVARALVERYGIKAYGHRGESTKDYYKALDEVLDGKPQVVVDDGADLISILHTRRRKDLARVVGANEETTTGVVRLKAMEADGALKIPVIDVNNAQMKHLFDNRYGTGQSAFDGIFAATNLLIAGKCVVVAGYGWCGRGIALRADGLGARVVVTEVDPVKAVEAVMDGFEVMPMGKAVEEADFLITATGVRDIVRGEHLKRIKDGCVLANAGHFNVEISPETLRTAATGVKRVRAGVDAYALERGRKVYLLTDGRLVNLAAGQGHPVEIMDMSFAIQYLCALRLWKERGTMAPGVHAVPGELDLEVARGKLETLGASIDTLTPAQRHYIASWDEGT